MDKEIIITKYDDKGFIEVKCADGHYITNWDKKDIMEFTDAKIMYCPLNYDIEKNKYYCLTDEEHKQYTATYEAKLKEMENNKQFN